MPKTPEHLVEIATRHAAHLESLKAGEVKAIRDLYGDMEQKVLGKLSQQKVTAWSRDRLNNQLTSIRSVMRQQYDENIIPALNKSIREIGVYEAEFEAKSLGKVADFNFQLPARDQILSAIRTNPLAMRGPDGGKLLTGFIKDWTSQHVERTTNTIRSGFAMGETTPQVIARLRDEVGPINRRGLEALTRTALQHCATQAREQVWERNKDIVKSVRWLSTIDSRVSDLCAALDGRTFPINEGPRPPAHPNACLQGTMIATLRGDVPIEDVVVGDMVKTHTGKYRRVYTVMARQHNGECRDLIDNFGRSVRLTNDHPVLTMGKGWINARDVQLGDVFFNDIEQLNRLDGFGESSLVPQAILSNSHNIKTSVTDELISYGIFSLSTGVSSAVQLNNHFSSDKEINKERADDFLHSKISTNRPQYRGKKSFVLSRVFNKRSPLAYAAFNAIFNRTHRIMGFHSIGRFLAKLNVSIRLLFTPMFIASRFRDVFCIVANRLGLAFNRYSMNTAPIIEGAGSNAVFSFNQPDAFPFAPMFSKNNVLNITPFHSKDLRILWLASTCTQIEVYHHKGYVYNLAVENDETFLADGFVVHNCRSTIVPELDERYKFLDDDATRRTRDPETGKVGYTDAKETYYGWLKRQPPNVQDSIIGPLRGRLLRDGGLTSQRFAELQLNKNFKPITLKEMRKLEPVAFEKAGLEVAN